MNSIDKKSSRQQYNNWPVQVFLEAVKLLVCNEQRTRSICRTLKSSETCAFFSRPGPTQLLFECRSRTSTCSFLCSLVVRMHAGPETTLRSSNILFSISARAIMLSVNMSPELRPSIQYGSAPTSSPDNLRHFEAFEVHCSGWMLQVIGSRVGHFPCVLRNCADMTFQCSEPNHVPQSRAVNVC